MSDNEILCALIGQVQKATSASARLKPCSTEVDVVTFITRPMWESFLRAVDLPTNSKPTPWQGIDKTIRVFGSETRVIESPLWWSISVPRSLIYA